MQLANDTEGLAVRFVSTKFGAFVDIFLSLGDEFHFLFKTHVVRWQHGIPGLLSK